MIPLVISAKIRAKLDSRHQVQEQELHECFLNHEGLYLIDTREEHVTDPPTLWFVGETHRGRKLKIMFVERDGNIYLKSAYDATDEIFRIYIEKTATGG